MSERVQSQLSEVKTLFGLNFEYMHTNDPHEKSVVKGVNSKLNQVVCN